MPKWPVGYYTASSCGSCDECGPSPVTDDESMGGKARHRGESPYAPCTRLQCSAPEGSLAWHLITCLCNVVKVSNTDLYWRVGLY